tara:strand:+ start:502 stop:870 length:369 start_codon:yes stop_codon:yes gene_type:complete
MSRLFTSNRYAEMVYRFESNQIRGGKKIDFSLRDRNALRRFGLSVLLTIFPAFCLPVMSAGDALTLQLKHEDELPQTVNSLTQLKVRAGDMLSLSPEYGEGFAVRVEISRRTNHGNEGHHPP